MKFLTAALLALALLLGGTLPVGVAPGEAQAPRVVRVAYLVQTHQAHMMVLPRFAEKHGIKVELTPMRRYADAQLAMTTNQVDLATIGYVSVGLMEDAGLEEYRVVAGLYTGAQNLTLAKDVKGAAWKDLEGLRIGTPPNSYAEALFKLTARANGADLSRIKLVSFTTPGPPMLAALRARDIDGFVSWEPTSAEAAVNGTGYYPPLDIGANETRGVNGILAVSARFAAQQGETVLATVRAVIDATNHLNAHQDEYAQIAQSGTGATLPVLRESMKRGVLDYKLYQREAEALMKLIAEAGIAKKNHTAVVEKRFDYQYLEKATGRPRRELGGR